MKAKIAIIVISIVAVLEGFVLIMVISKPFPPEYVYSQVPSEDGKWIALFTVKHQGIISWIPEDIEPHYYLTLVDTRHGRACIRDDAYCGNMKASFAELAREHAPWALAEFEK